MRCAHYECRYHAVEFTMRGPLPTLRRKGPDCTLLLSHEPQTVTTIARVLGLSRQRVQEIAKSKRIQRALRILRRDE